MNTPRIVTDYPTVWPLWLRPLGALLCRWRGHPKRPRHYAPPLMVPGVRYLRFCCRCRVVVSEAEIGTWSA